MEEMGTAKIFLATVRNEVRKLLRKPIRRSVRPATRDEMNSIGDRERVDGDPITDLL